MGGVAVVASLIYVGLQVRQNTKAVAASTYHSVSTAVADVGLRLSSNDPLLEAMEVSHADPDSLTTRQELRLNALFRSTFRNWENIRHQNKQGFLDDDLWSGYHENIRDQLGSAYVRRWWSNNEFVFNPGFRRYINQEMRSRELGPTAFYQTANQNIPSEEA